MISFQVYVLFCFAFSTASTVWTCDSCQRASEDLAEVATSDNVLAAGTASIVAEICPASEDPDSSEAFLPEVWEAIAKIVYPVAWSHLCDYILDDCPSHAPPAPGCEACELRIKWAVEYLRDHFARPWTHFMWDQGSKLQSQTPTFPHLAYSQTEHSSTLPL